VGASVHEKGSHQSKGRYGLKVMRLDPYLPRTRTTLPTVTCDEPFRCVTVLWHGRKLALSEERVTERTGGDRLGHPEMAQAAWLALVRLAASLFRR
jgi:hypothetical protein